jgi:site-specific recombinase XerD
MALKKHAVTSLQVAKTVNKSKDLFEKYLFINNLSPKTSKRYLKILSYFEVFISSDRTLLSANKDDFVKFVLKLMLKKRSVNTINNYLTVLRTFYRAMFEYGFIDDQRFKIVPVSRRAPRRIPRWLSESEMSQLIESPDPCTFTGIRDKLILSILYDTGMRASEILNLTVQDIDFSSLLVFISNAKGGKQRHVPIGEKTVEILKDYLRFRNVLQKRNTQTLLLSYNGMPIKSTKTIWDIVNRYGVKATGKSVYTHLIRHTTATHLLQNGADIRDICEILGHKTISTTQKYTHTDITYLKREYKKAFPYLTSSEPLA